MVPTNIILNNRDNYLAMHILPSTYQNPVYPYKRSEDQDEAEPSKHQVIIIGAGPVGLSVALDLGNRGISCIVLTKGNTVSVGSRAICFAKKTLEIMQKLDPEMAKRMLNKGVTWNKGKVFYQEDQVYEFNLLPESGHKMPAFINLQQYYFEEYLVEKVDAHPLVDLRWHNEVVDSGQNEEEVWVKIHTPDGEYELKAAYLLACDGVHSPTRERMGIPFQGEKFAENFLIADITMENDFPTERWFWFDPPFNPGYSALLHKQPDGVWRIDLQLGWDIDKEQELDPERIKGRLRQMLGDAVQFELEWTSIYQFRCMRIDEFIHGRVIFLGDSAHLVSPFGARGANSGIQDAENLAWKLAYVIQGKAPETLLATYQAERSPAADENIYHSTNATDFISPKSAVSTLFRNATLDLAKYHPSAQKLVNSGRLSDPFRYVQSPLTTPDMEAWDSDLQPGHSMKDIPLEYGGKKTQLVDVLGNGFTLLVYAQNPAISEMGFEVVYINENEWFETRYGASEGTWYLIRPDHHIAARGKGFDKKRIEQAMEKALGKASDSRDEGEDSFKRYAHDQSYKLLLEAHKGLSKAESDALNAKLILLMMEKVDLAEVLISEYRTRN